MTETSALDQAPAECTLPTAERPLRVAEFDELFRSSTRSIQHLSATRGRVVFDPAAQERARDLAARESECCSFFEFAFTDTPEGLVLDITVAEDKAGVLGALLNLGRAGT